MRARTLWILTTTLSLGLLLVACGGQETDEETIGTESIQESLELSDSGGFEMQDELPAFGLLDLDELAVEANLEVPELPEELDTLAGKMPPDPNLPLPGPPPCPHGLLKGKWKVIKNINGKGYGVFKGKWASANGKVVGHLKGIFGSNKLGHGVLFGKYISKGGKFLGVLKGRYGKGFFKGHWFDKHGVKGELMGAYDHAKCVATNAAGAPNSADTAAGPDSAGVNSATGVKKCLPGLGNFVGKWRAYCPMCKLNCMPGYVQPAGLCICVPPKVIPCKMGQCPQGMFCDLCPPLPGCNCPCNCPAVCAPPICKPLPPKPAPAPGQPDNAAPENNVE